MWHRFEATSDALRALLVGGSGPRVARLFHRLVAGISIVAWLSLHAQIELLIGRRGLLPVEDFLHRAELLGYGFSRIPTFAWWLSSDRFLVAGTWLGVALGLLALLGLLPRLTLLASTLLYLGYSHACQDFLSFQWDNLLVEAGLLAALLPTDRAAPGRHLLLRLLLFKLYFESGLAKWQSPIGDWKDGSAMTFYYETAPLPTWLGWYAHQLPAAWHHFESWAMLALETFGAFAILGPRPARVAALFAFTGFQAVNLATANYGFFVYLALSLHVFLLDDRDLERPSAFFARRIPDRVRAARSRLRARVRLPRISLELPRLSRTVTIAALSAWLFFSLGEGLAHFARYRGHRELFGAVRPFRVANAYYLFTSITRDRFEPIFETFDGKSWTEQVLRYKPGPPGRPPAFVAPHQPRVDFLLWFYGINPMRGPPRYVRALVDHLCRDPEAVQPLFSTRLPRAPRAVRIRVDRYRFTTRAERRESGDWWHRSPLGIALRRSCARARSLPPALSAPPAPAAPAGPR